MKTIRTLLWCVVAASVLAGCGENSTDSELKRQREEEMANKHREKCARAAKHGRTAKMKEWGCPQDAAASQSN